MIFLEQSDRFDVVVYNSLGRSIATVHENGDSDGGNDGKYCDNNHDLDECDAFLVALHMFSLASRYGCHCMHHPGNFVDRPRLEGFGELQAKKAISSYHQTDLTVQMLR
tara:strand:+ start:244 stop:570 length:327 start_codon:yes stop_codon:yes gene_type:complete